MDSKATLASVTVLAMEGHLPNTSSCNNIHVAGRHVIAAIPMKVDDDGSDDDDGPHAYGIVKSLTTKPANLTLEGFHVFGAYKYLSDQFSVPVSKSAFLVMDTKTKCLGVEFVVYGDAQDVTLTVTTNDSTIALPVKVSHNQPFYVLSNKAIVKIQIENKSKKYSAYSDLFLLIAKPSLVSQSACVPAL